MTEYEGVIGMEVHAELLTESKMFCDCSAEFGGEPNSRTCPVCLGLPGALPVANRKAVEYVVRTALALNCTVSQHSIFHRKNYFYPDLPKNYQISQYGDTPIGVHGWIDVTVGEETRRIRIRRVHLEEDTGKLIHASGSDESLIDFNRSTVPLMEIVSEADIHSAEEAREYLVRLRAILTYLGVNDGKMEEGSLRCEPNISVREKGTQMLGTRTELKNLNSFRSVYRGSDYEIARQAKVLQAGGKIVHETRRWDDANGVTAVMRTKEFEQPRGKTTLSIGLCRALRSLGLVVQPFKKGPDYIDPLWLGQAAGRPCLNLDFHTMDRGEILSAFAREIQGADLGLIEGNLGLFDSTDIEGENSNAALAKHLGAPVVLVLDCEGMARGIAPLLLGYQAFDPDLRIAGLVLNKVGGDRHAANLIRAVEHYTDLPILGTVLRDEGMAIAERHLGLMPSNESEEAESRIEAIARRVAATLNLDRVIALSQLAERPLVPGLGSAPWTAAAEPLVRIGIARDAAFGFYYPDDLRALADGGTELVPFSPIADREPPTVDGLFLGGGFPEYRMDELERNRTMREAIAAFVTRGGPVYAECGGLMYLCKTLRWGDRCRAMAGAIDAEVEMRPRPQGRGYVELLETRDFPWPADDAAGEARTAGRRVHAHEFHHSAIVAPRPDWTYAYEVRRGVGIDGRHDGIVQGNLLACYAHLRDVGGNGWTRRFLAHVRRCRANR